MFNIWFYDAHIKSNAGCGFRAHIYTNQSNKCRWLKVELKLRFAVLYFCVPGRRAGYCRCVVCLPLIIRIGLVGCRAAIVVITHPLPWDGGTARTAIQLHTVNLIEIRLGERWQPISNQS